MKHWQNRNLSLLEHFAFNQNKKDSILTQNHQTISSAIFESTFDTVTNYGGTAELR